MAIINGERSSGLVPTPDQKDALDAAPTLSTSNPVVGQDYAGLGCKQTLAFGCETNASGTLLRAGFFVGGGVVGISPITSQAWDATEGVLFDGTINEMSLNSASGDATTVYRILVDGVVAKTLSGYASTAFISGINLAVSAGERVSVEWNSGTNPYRTQVILVVE